MYNKILSPFFKFGVVHAIEPNKCIYSNCKNLKCSCLNFGYVYIIEFFMMLISH